MEPAEGLNKPQGDLLWCLYLVAERIVGVMHMNHPPHICPPPGVKEDPSEELSWSKGNRDGIPLAAGFTYPSPSLGKHGLPRSQLEPELQLEEARSGGGPPRMDAAPQPDIDASLAATSARC